MISTESQKGVYQSVFTLFKERVDRMDVEQNLA